MCSKCKTSALLRARRQGHPRQIFLLNLNLVHLLRRLRKTFKVLSNLINQNLVPSYDLLLFMCVSFDPIKRPKFFFFLLLIIFFYPGSASGIHCYTSSPKATARSFRDYTYSVVSSAVAFSFSFATILAIPFTHSFSIPFAFC